MKTFARRFVLLATVSMIAASCGGMMGGGHRIRIKALVSPEDAKAALGGDVGPVGHDSIPELENKGEQSFQSNLKFTTTGEIKRELSVQVSAWEVNQKLADDFFDSQSMSLLENVEGGTTRVEVKELGDAAEGFTTGHKKFTAVVAKRGKVVIIAKVSGGEAPDDQVAKLKDLVAKIFSQIQPF